MAGGVVTCLMFGQYPGDLIFALLSVAAKYEYERTRRAENVADNYFTKH